MQDEFPIKVVYSPSHVSQLENDEKFLNAEAVNAGDNITVETASDGSITISANGGGGGGGGENGATFTPVVKQVAGNAVEISWVNDKNLPNPQAITITAPKGDPGNPGDPGTPGDDGDNGATFTPVATVNGATLTLNWVNNAGLVNPEPVQITAPKGDQGDTPVLEKASQTVFGVSKIWGEGETLYIVTQE